MTKLTKINLDISKIPEFVEAKKTQQALVEANPFIKVVDNASHEEAKKTRTALVRGRTSIEKGDKAIASKLREFRAAVKTKADELIAITKPAEDKQQAAITPFEDEKEKARLEKERKKQEEMAAWLKKAQAFLNYTDKLVNPATTEEVTAIIKEVEAVEVDEETFGPYALIAEQNKAKLLEQAEGVEARMIAVAEAETKRKEIELESARKAYAEYFKMEYNETNDAATLLQGIEDDKRAKLKRLEELEAKETARIEKENADKLHREGLEKIHMDIIGVDMSGMTDEQLEADILKYEEFKQKEQNIKEAELEKMKSAANAIPQLNLPSSEQMLIKAWRGDLKEKLSEMPSHVQDKELLKGVYDAAELVKQAIDGLKKYI